MAKWKYSDNDNKGNATPLNCVCTRSSWHATHAIVPSGLSGESCRLTTTKKKEKEEEKEKEKDKTKQNKQNANKMTNWPKKRRKQ